MRLIIYQITQLTLTCRPGNSTDELYGEAEIVCRVEEMFAVIREVVNFKAAVMKVGMCSTYVN